MGSQSTIQRKLCISQHQYTPRRANSLSDYAGHSARYGSVVDPAWHTVNDQLVPDNIERLENGLSVWKLTGSSWTVTPRLDDGTFARPAISTGLCGTPCNLERMRGGEKMTKAIEFTESILRGD